ncbi:hypothetical protein HYZ64_02105 [Candidatus Berkelbacteria bacterium]|nr:hypothetical protein [Candidatus Berkelbacteria bacterium]
MLKHLLLTIGLLCLTNSGVRAQEGPNTDTFTIMAERDIQSASPENLEKISKLLAPTPLPNVPQDDLLINDAPFELANGEPPAGPLTSTTFDGNVTVPEEQSEFLQAQTAPEPRILVSLDHASIMPEPYAFISPELAPQDEQAALEPIDTVEDTSGHPELIVNIPPGLVLFNNRILEGAGLYPERTAGVFISAGSVTISGFFWPSVVSDVLEDKSGEELLITGNQESAIRRESFVIYLPNRTRPDFILR